MRISIAAVSACVVGVGFSLYMAKAESQVSLETPSSRLATQIKVQTDKINALEAQLAEYESELAEAEAREIQLNGALSTAIESTAALQQEAIDRQSALSAPVRDESKPLVVQTKNPGALMMGERARRYGAIHTLPEVTGQPVAVFPTREHGVGAMIDLINVYNGRPVRDYISDYSSNPDYLSWMDDQGVPADLVIHMRNPDQIEAILQAQVHIEDNRQPLLIRSEFDAGWNHFWRRQ